jgi:hypothetical protein
MSSAVAQGNGVTTMRETERKYEAMDDWELLDPAGLLGFASGTGPHEQDLNAVYFDTADLRLLRAGITLRRREGAVDPGWHLKLPAGKDSRDELRLPLGRSPHRPPAELVALTRVYARGAALAPVAELTTRRRRWVLADADGHALAELVDDHVTAHSMDEQTTTLSWREVEVELAQHTQRKLLDRIDAGCSRWAPSGRVPPQSWVGCWPTGYPLPRHRRLSGLGRLDRWYWPTCGRRSSSCVAMTGWCDRTPRMRCTRCGWLPGGCAARCKHSVESWTGRRPVS